MISCLKTCSLRQLSFSHKNNCVGGKSQSFLECLNLCQHILVYSIIIYIITSRNPQQCCDDDLTWQRLCNQYSALVQKISQPQNRYHWQSSRWEVWGRPACVCTMRCSLTTVQRLGRKQYTHILNHDIFFTFMLLFERSHHSPSRHAAQLLSNSWIIVDIQHDGSIPHQNFDYIYADCRWYLSVILRPPTTS